jgi:hypothetical protein
MLVNLDVVGIHGHQKVQLFLSNGNNLDNESILIATVASNEAMRTKLRERLRKQKLPED